MATYKWRVPMLSAVQFDGKNTAEIKEFVGDDSDGEKIMVSADPPEYEEKKIEDAEPVEVAIEPPPTDPKAPKTKKVQPTEQVEKKTELRVKKGDWVTNDVVTNKIEVNPEGFPEEYEQVSA